MSTFRSNRILITLAILLVGAACMLTWQTVSAQTNPEINYQGKLASSTGATVADGDYDITFRLYTQASGGSPIWTESRTGANAVNVKSGLFSVMLGSTSPLTGVDFNQTLYLGLQIESDSEMSPRKVLGTVPAAFEARRLEGLSSSSFLRSDVANSASALVSFLGGASTTDLTSTGTTTVTTFQIDGETYTSVNGPGLENDNGTLTANISEGQLNIPGSPTDGYVLQASSTAPGGFVWVSASSTGAGDGTFLGLSDTQNSFTSNRLLFTNGAGDALTDSADLTFDGSQLTVGGTGISLSGTTANLTLGSNWLSGDGDDEGVYVTGAGNVGIGTSSPASKLDVWGDFRVGTSGTPTLFADTSSGFFGINTDNPGYALDVVGSMRISGNVRFSSYVDSDNSDYFVNPSTSGISAAFAGSVGIGTTSPSSKLTVAGDIYATGAFKDSTNSAGTNGYVLQTTGTGTQWVATSTLGFASGGGASAFTDLSDTQGSLTANRLIYTNDAGDALTDAADFVYNTTGLGIGTTSPSAKLTVAGDINIDDGNGGLSILGTRYFYASTTLNNLSIGQSAGASYLGGVTDANHSNVAIGYQAGQYASTTTSYENKYNNFIGYQAGQNNTGKFNNLSGVGAGKNNTGQDNNFFGRDAGEDNVGGSNNFFGYRAGSNNSGNGNNIFGSLAGRYNSGYGNNLFGYYAGGDNTGANNNFFGYYAGSANTGDYNNFFGYQTGRYLQSTSTVAIGGEALYGGSTYQALNNVALGYRAGYSAQTGASNNILLGYQAADSLTTGANNIIIGYDVEAPSNTGSNQLNIGNLLFGTGIDGTGTSLSSGNIGIGTTSPSSKLTVAGDLYVTGAFKDSTNSAGTDGYILQTTGAGTQWVATSSLGFAAAGSGVTTFTGLSDTQGSLSANRLIFTNSAGDTLTDSSNLTFDGSELDVTGTIDSTGGYKVGDVLYFDANATSRSITIGQGAGDSFTDSTGDNVAIGYRAGADVSDASSDNNVFVGRLAGDGFEGIQNTILGSEAGSFGGSGTGNILLGPEAGESQTGDYNISLGTNAGTDTEGSYNVHLGYRTAANTSAAGSYNVSLGYEAGYEAHGSYNTSLGYRAGQYNVGDFNAFIGHQAGRYLYQATNTVAIGGEALYGGSSYYQARNNTALGYRAGYNAQGGASNNLLLGYQAADNLTTGANNIVLGYDVDLQDSTQSNTLNIGNLLFGTGLTATGTTLSSGNIGIGTTSPSSKLTVAGDLYATGAFKDSTNSAGTNGYVLQTTGSGTQWVATSSLGFAAAGSGVTTFTGLSDTQGSLSANRLIFTNGAGDALTDSTGLTFDGSQLSVADSAIVGGSTMPSAGDPRLVVNNGDSEVGLAVRRTSASAFSYFEMFNESGDSVFRLNEDSLLLLGDGMDTGLGRASAGNLSVTNSVGSAYWTLGAGGIMAGTDNSYDIGANGSNRARDLWLGRDAYIGGDIAVGTTSANAKLTVAGDINIDDSSAGISWMGTRYLYASSTNESVAFGEGAGETFNSVAGYNVAIGFAAGQRASTSGANYNNYIGHEAGQNNSGGVNNIFGRRAGKNNQGVNNNILGYISGYENKGDKNNILGFAAGYYNEGSNNNILGYYAGFSNVGDFNDLIGYNSGRYLQSTSTVAIGGEALYGGTGSAYQALNNVALGYRAGYSAQTGASNNILLGYQAADSLTTGANNIVIGYDVEAPSNTASNQLNIGNLVFGTGIDGTGTTLSSGNIGIGTSSPASKLDVWGDFRVGTSSDPLALFDTAADTITIGTTTAGSAGLTTNRSRLVLRDTFQEFIPGNPKGVGSIVDGTGGANNLGGATGVAIKGSYAYVASFSDSSVQVLDISDPTNPVGVGFIADGSNGATELQGAGSIAVAGDYAYVTGYDDNGVQILDISDPTNPVGVGSVNNGESGTDELLAPADIVVSGNYAYVTGYNADGVQILDISDPTSPVGVGSITDGAGGADVLNGAFGIAVVGNYAYVTALSDNGVQILDISDPTNPVGVGSITDGVGGADTLAGAWDIEVAGTNAYVASNGDNGVQVLDISDPASPTGVGSITDGQAGADELAEARGVELVGNYLFVLGNLDDGVQIIDVTDPVNPTGVGSITDGANGADALDSPYDIEVVGNYAYVVSDTDSGLQILDLGGLQTPTAEIGSLLTHKIYTDFVRIEDLLTVDGGFNVGQNAFIGGSLAVGGNASSSLQDGTPSLFVNEAGVGLGTTSPDSLLDIYQSGVTGAQSGFGLDQYFITENATDGALQIANRSYLNASNTATTTIVNSLVRVADDTTFGNTVRALEVQADRGANTQGENTALSGFARTFGVRGTTRGDAGGSFEPAGVYGETQGTTQGNAIRGYSSSITTATLLSLFQDTSDYTGTGLLMNFGNSGGSFSSTTSKFVDFQNAGTSKFTVSAHGTTTIGDGTTNNMAGLQIGYGGLCVDNDGSCTASTTGRISAVSYGTYNSDLAELYFSDEELEPGEIVVGDGGLSIGRATSSESGRILGVVSTKPGITMGADDTSLTPGQTAYPLALSGRVPIKLSTENGPIREGDPIMLSSIPGVGMKATGSAQIVGYALEDFTGERAYSAGFVNQFGDDIAEPQFEPLNVNEEALERGSCYYGAGEAADATSTVVCDGATYSDYQQEVKEENARREAEAMQRELDQLSREGAEAVTLSEDKTVAVGQALMFVNLTEIDDRTTEDEFFAELMSTSTVPGETGETWWERIKSLAGNFVDGVLTIAGLKADRVETQELCVDDVCVDADDLRGLLEASQDAAGSASDTDDSASTDTSTTDPTDDASTNDPTTGDEPAGSDNSTTTDNTSTSSATSTEDTTSSTDDGVTAEAPSDEPATSTQDGAEDDVTDTAGSTTTQDEADTESASTTDTGTSDDTDEENDDTTKENIDISSNSEEESESTGETDGTTDESTEDSGSADSSADGESTDASDVESTTETTDDASGEAEVSDSSDV